MTTKHCGALGILVLALACAAGMSRTEARRHTAAAPASRCPSPAASFTTASTTEGGRAVPASHAEAAETRPRGSAFGNPPLTRAMARPGRTGQHTHINGAARHGGLPPALERQVERVRALSGAGASGTARAQMLAAIARLEETLPRSRATIGAQARGRAFYVKMVNSRSAALARAWPAVRRAIELQLSRDRRYSSAVEALDRRLAGAVRDAHGGPDLFAATTAAPLPTHFNSLPLDRMQPGDIMVWDDRSGPPLVRSALALFANKCTHTALYLGETTSRNGVVQRWTLEAKSPVLGVRAAPMDWKWCRQGLHVSLGRVRGVTRGRAARIAAAAVATFGTDGRTPYHMWPPWDKTYNGDGQYCSQLVWTIYRANGVDLDSNDWRYLTWFTVHNWFNPYAAPTAYFAVFPDEIKTSPHIVWYYDQVNS